MITCLDCGSEISSARLEFLPHTRYCVSCADKNATPTVARLIYNHKTAGEVFIAKGKENVRILEREYTRGR
jgi:hypothetical protein